MVCAQPPSLPDACARLYLRLSFGLLAEAPIQNEFARRAKKEKPRFVDRQIAINEKCDGRAIAGSPLSPEVTSGRQGVEFFFLG